MSPGRCACWTIARDTLSSSSALRPPRPRVSERDQVGVDLAADGEHRRRDAAATSSFCVTPALPFESRATPS
jgi:hypothetical protein